MRWAIGSLLLVVMLTTNLATAVPGFTDVPAGHVFESQVNWMAEQGITRGCNPPINDQFCPDDPVTRGQMAAFLVRALDLTEVDPNLDVFEDTIDSFFLSDIMILATSGITKGCNPPANDRFCPDDVVTRGQMGAFLVRSFGLTEVDPDVSFGDADDSVFRTDIVRLATAGITKGCNPPANDWYCPNDVVTRGQMAAFLHRATGLLPRITTEELSGGTVGEPYTSTLVAAGGEPPYSWTVTGLPDGVVHNSGDLVGTPTANGTWTVAVGLEDSRGGEASGSLVIDVDLPLGIVTEVLPVGTTGEPYTFSVVATGGEPPHEWSADGLPDGLSVRADGSFAGAATVPGLSVVELVVADTEGRVDTRPLLLEVSGPLTIVKSELPSGTVGESYSGSLEAAGGEPPYTWTVTSEPPGIEADSTGAMTGTPTLSGEYTLNVAVTDADGRITVAAVLFDVDHPLDIVTDSLDDAALYRTYDMSLIATGGEPAYSWTSPNLPDGLTLDPSGSISGTPDYFGNHWISFTATDADGRTAAVDFDLFVRGMMWASMSASGEPSNDECHSGAISGDGRYVAFSSQAGNLTDGDDNHQIDVFRQDRQTGEVVWVSVDPTNDRDGEAAYPSIDYDGDVVVFRSYASGIVPADTNNSADIFVTDMNTGEVTRISVSSDGAEANGSSSGGSISDDGRYVVFKSAATNLVADDTNGKEDLFLHDRRGGETTRVSLDYDGNQLIYGASTSAISGDGRYLVFSSGSPELDTGAAGLNAGVFRRDLATGEIITISHSHDGSELDATSLYPMVGYDGSWVAYRSHASNVVAGDDNAKSDIFLYEVATGTTTLVTVAPDGSSLDADSWAVGMSADGRFVTFSTNATNVGPLEAHYMGEAYVWDRNTALVTRLSLTPDGGAPNSGTSVWDISADGAWAVVRSHASDVAPGDTNLHHDIFVVAIDLEQ